MPRTGGPDRPTRFATDEAQAVPPRRAGSAAASSPSPDNVAEVRTPRAEPGAKGGVHFDVFLSYNSRDSAIVERIAERLKRSGLEPWLDKWAQTPGGEWQAELGRGFEASHACAVFVGPSDLGSWGLEELGREDGVALIVLLEGFQQLYQYRQNPITYDSTGGRLKHETFLFAPQAGSSAAGRGQEPFLAGAVGGPAAQMRTASVVHQAVAAQESWEVE